MAHYVMGDIHGEADRFVEFINTIASMLPNACRVSLDINEEHANWCFQYDKIMFCSVLLEIAILSETMRMKRECWIK